MAIISFALTTEEFLSGNKTVTRRDWSEKQFKMWQSFWDKKSLIHDAWDKVPRAGGKRIGKLRLTSKPYKEKLKNMPLSDLVAEGGMCATLEEYYMLIGKTPDDWVTVIRFERVER